ncbi:MAG: hypothetical protein R3B46_10545 [Phycisphaerales bacterium]
MSWTPKTEFPVPTARIPTPPFGEMKDRRTVWYDEYAKTGGYDGLRKALSMKPADVVDTVKTAELRGGGGLPHRVSGPSCPRARTRTARACTPQRQCGRGQAGHLQGIDSSWTSIRTCCSKASRSVATRAVW